MGTQRIGSVVDTGTVQLTIHFGAGERSVTLSGYASAPPRVKAIGGGAGAVSYDAVNHLFHVVIAPAADAANVTVILTPSRLTSTRIAISFSIGKPSAFSSATRITDRATMPPWKTPAQQAGEPPTMKVR